MVREFGYRLFSVTISDKRTSCWCHSAGAFKTLHTSSLSLALTQLMKERKVIKEIKPQRKGRWSRMKNPLAQLSLSSTFGSHRDLLLGLKGVFCFLEGVTSFSYFPLLHPHGALPAEWLLCWLWRGSIGAVFVLQPCLTLICLERMSRMNTGILGD